MNAEEFHALNARVSAPHSRLYWFLYNYSGGASLHWNERDCPTHEQPHAQLEEVDGKFQFVKPMRRLK
jgi:hypothetical protein